MKKTFLIYDLIFGSPGATFFITVLHPIVAKVGGLQSQGVDGEAVVIYREPLTTLDLESSGFPGG